MDPKRVALFVVASLAGFLAISWLQQRNAPPPPPPAAVVVPGTQATAEAPAVGAPAPGDVGAPAPGDVGAPAAVAAAAETAPRRLVLQTSTQRIEVSNVGGRITSWKLLDHGEYGNRDLPLELVRRRIPVDAAPETAPAVPGSLEASDTQDVLPFQVRTGDAALDDRLAREALHVLSLESDGAQQVLTAAWSDGAGLSVTKKLVVVEGDPLLRIEAGVTRDGAPVGFHLLWGPGIANHDPKDSGNTYLKRGEVRWRTQGEVNAANRPKDANEMPVQGIDWASLEDSFFCATFVPGSLDGPGTPRFGFEVTGQLQPDARGKVRKREWPTELVLAVPFGPADPHALLYVGPREKKVLAALEQRIPGERDLPRLVHLGILDPIASVMHAILLWLHERVHSWGVAIVLLTLIIRAALFPFTHVTLKKNRALQDKMKGIQPQLKALQERFRKQPRSAENLNRMREEQAALYAQAGVNPAEMLGGCLPMLLSLPFFFALFKLLPNAAEFRHEPFLWWPDLSAGDPTHVWPILMAATMLISTWLGMSSAPAMDPMQRNMFLLLPLVFTVFCWSAPLGLVVYWTVSNVVQIGQQQLLKLTVPSPDSAKKQRPPRSARDGDTLPAVAEARPLPAKARKKGRKR